ncbi:MAG: histidine phosphotransferase family protein [Alphaproteobacteria bacterium]
MNSESEVRLVELLCSRLCHDLVSPIGAIHNGLELLAQEEGDMEEEIISLLSKSSDEASRRLRFFRVAFGQAGGSAEMLSFTEGRALLDGFLKGGRISLDWTEKVEPSAPIARGSVKLLLNMALLASETLPYGGGLAVVPSCHSGGTRLEVVAHGEKAAFKDGLAEALQREMPVEDLNPRNVLAYFLAFLANRFDFALSVRRDTGAVTLQATHGSEN